MSPFPDYIVLLSTRLLEACREEGIMLATAESCTGGLIAAALTEIAGSSDVFDRGFVTYSNGAKMDMIGVSAETLKIYGAVSELVAREMASGALERSRALMAVSVTGVAGPGGGSVEKPVGTVHVCVRHGNLFAHRKLELGDIGRSQIRMETVRQALKLCLSTLSV